MWTATTMNGGQNKAPVKKNKENPSEEKLQPSQKFKKHIVEIINGVKQDMNSLKSDLKDPIEGKKIKMLIIGCGAAVAIVIGWVSAAYQKAQKDKEIAALKKQERAEQQYQESLQESKKKHQEVMSWENPPVEQKQEVIPEEKKTPPKETISNNQEQKPFNPKEVIAEGQMNLNGSPDSMKQLEAVLQEFARSSGTKKK